MDTQAPPANARPELHTRSLLVNAGATATLFFGPWPWYPWCEDVIFQTPAPRNIATDFDLYWATHTGTTPPNSLQRAPIFSPRALTDNMALAPRRFAFRLRTRAPFSPTYIRADLVNGTGAPLTMGVTVLMLIPPSQHQN